VAEAPPKTPAERFSRLFRKAGVFLAKRQYHEALTVLREGEALALSLGDEQRLALFREEIARCLKGSVMAIAEIKNFVSVSDALATAGQPSEDQLHQLAQEGFEVIINLGLLDPRYCLADEAEAVRSLSMEYHHIPVDFQAPKRADLEQFFQVMDACTEKKVFVHCAANYRVSSFISLYGQARFGWSLEQANEHIRRLWEPNEVWMAFIEEARQALPVSADNN
jgi:protein tyrosine phosphatase (PTP) superfamily phosphohydrolase (DUF442 family)